MRSGDMKSGRIPKKGTFSDLEFYIRDLSKLNQKIYILTMIPPARNRNYSPITTPLVIFLEKNFSMDTPQVILYLMTPVSSFYHICGLRKRAVTHTHAHRF
jgi:hypothetical protein